MADYASMYKRLFAALTDVIEILQKAQQDAEIAYIEAEEPKIVLLDFDKHGEIALKRLSSVSDSFFVETFALYEISFPERERRVLDKQAAIMTNPFYHCDVLTKQDTLVGILFWWELSGRAYIEHFAIDPSMRGQAYGSRSLEIFCEANPVVVLEIDPPDDDISVCREHFYHRLGFQTNRYVHLHPAYRKPFPPHKLFVMSYPSLITESEYRVFQEELSNVVMKDSFR
jgi:ribosomal protein S18 acetylase RimI-like enzyme